MSESRLNEKLTNCKTNKYHGMLQSVTLFKDKNCQTLHYHFVHSVINRYNTSIKYVLLLHTESRQ